MCCNCSEVTMTMSLTVRTPHTIFKIIHIMIPCLWHIPHLSTKKDVKPKRCMDVNQELTKEINSQNVQEEIDAKASKKSLKKFMCIKPDQFTLNPKRQVELS